MLLLATLKPTGIFKFHYFFYYTNNNKNYYSKDKNLNFILLKCVCIPSLVMPLCNRVNCPTNMEYKICYRGTCTQGIAGVVFLSPS